MTSTAPTRRLTTILAADMVGYSARMAADEDGTQRAIRDITDTVIAPVAQRFGGRIVKEMGDGLLLEFGSVVDGLNAAVAVQETLKAREDAAPFRIGLNIGDVIAEGSDLYGTGVNVAARLESLTDPGGICVSGTVHDHVQGKVDVGFRDLGTQRVKNIPDPVRVYAVTGDGMAAPVRLRRLPWRPLTALAVVVAAAVGVYLWQMADRPSDATAEPARMAFPLPDKPSLVVLPFTDLSPDAQAVVFADGVTEDLITDLSRISGLFVIARNSTFSFDPDEGTIAGMAERMGVRYVLQGSVRQSGEGLRVNAKLIDTQSGVHVWTDRFDGQTGDIFAMQDRIVATTVAALELQLTDRERDQIERTDTRQLAAKEAFQRGWALYSRFNAEDNARAVPHFEEAIRIDPTYGRAYGSLALVYLRGSIFAWDKPLGEQEALLRHRRAPAYLRQAEEHGTALVHVVRAMQYLFYRHSTTPQGANGGTDDARREAAAAIAAQPNDPEAHIMMGWALISAGRADEGANFVASAKRLNPSWPSHYDFFDAAAQYTQGDIERAGQILRVGLRRAPDATELMPMAASVYASLGLRQEAADTLQRWQPDASAEELDFIIEHYGFPIRWVRERRDLDTRLVDGLRLAALPPDQTVASLNTQLGQGDPDTRTRTIRKLGWNWERAAPAVPGLLSELGAENRRVRREATIALGKIGPAASEAIPLLRTLTDQPIIGFHATTAIARIEGAD